MDAHLVILITAVGAARLLVDELAEAVEEAAFEDLDAGVEQSLVEAERGELAHRMRQPRDPDAELPDLGRALVDAARDAVPMQVQRQREAGNSAADDRDVHQVGPLLGLTSPRLRGEVDIRPSAHNVGGGGVSASLS